jgi:hypothetical protein
MRYLTSDDISYEKIWLELQALEWNRPDLRERLARVNEEWRTLLLEVYQPRRDHGIDMPARGARLARDDVQPRDHARASRRAEGSA